MSKQITPASTRPVRSGRLANEAVSYVLLPAATFFSLVLLWEVLPPLLEVPAYILPVPSAFFAEFVNSFPQLFGHSLVTIQEIVYGFIAGVLISVPLALLIVSNKTLEKSLYPLIIFFQLIPKIAIAPLFIVWFGFGLFPKVFFTFLLCFFPVLVSSMSGFRELDPRILYLTRSMGASSWQTFRAIRLPAALPSIFSGMKVSIVLATTGAIVAEFVGANAGLGYLLLRATTFLNMPLIFACLMALCIIGLLFSFAVTLLESLVMPWKRQRRI